MINKIGENTENIRYVGNTWQKSGSIDNAKCMYTPENLLNLLYKDVEYSKGKFIYKARKDDSLDSNSPALLSHDLILVNTHFYTGTATESGNVIYTLTDYLKYGISISNPIYSITSKTRYLHLINTEKVKAGDCELAELTLEEFANLFKLGDNFKINVDNIIWYLKKKYGYSGTENPTMQVFLNAITDSNLRKFEDDFSLPLHDPESIRLPFHKQIVEDFEAKQNFNRIATRFIANSATVHCPAKFGNGFKSYIEKLSDVEEMALTGVSQQEGDTASETEYVFNGKSIKPSSMDINASECWLSAAEHDAIQAKLDMANETNQIPDDCLVDLDSSERILSKLSSVSTVGGLSSILPPVYIGFAEETDMLQGDSALAMQLNIPQDKATVLINDEDYETWDIFGGVVLGYKLVDALLAQRTFLGSLWGLGIVSDIAVNSQLNLEDPLYKSFKGYPEFVFSDNGDKLSYDYSDGTNYESIRIFNKLYYLSNGTKEDLLAPVVQDWLENESVIFKAPYFGDFIEEKNFEQDLTPHSTVEFETLLVDQEKSNKTRFADSITRVPYMEQTPPLINNIEKEESRFAHASKSFLSLGTIKDEKNGFFVTPPFLYDDDKGDESNLLNGNKPIIKTGKGDARIEERIISKTIDEIWTYIKYLSEDTKEGLPGFYGITADALNYQNDKLPIRVNPVANVEDVKQIDILNWKPNIVEEFQPEFSNDENPELIFKGWSVDKYITKVLDYKVKPFSRGKAEGSYPYNTEDEDSNVTDYLTQIYNSAILAFDLLEDSFNVITLDDGDSYLDSKLFGIEDADKLSVTRRNARDLLTKILNYESDLHIHYKEYLSKPKNLKAIERDLETIRQNLQTLAEFIVTTYTSRGFADRNTNRGTLHTLHRNAFDFEDTFLKDDDDSLNNPSDDLIVEELDKKVVFEDGKKRYIHADNGGTFGVMAIDLSDPIENMRDVFNYEGLVNKTFLRDVYLAADGTWRSIHEETILPIIDDEF